NPYFRFAVSDRNSSQTRVDVLSRRIVRNYCSGVGCLSHALDDAFQYGDVWRGVWTVSDRMGGVLRDSSVSRHAGERPVRDLERLDRSPHGRWTLADDARRVRVRRVY